MVLQEMFGLEQVIRVETGGLEEENQKQKKIVRDMQKETIMLLGDVGVHQQLVGFIKIFLTKIKDFLQVGILFIVLILK